MMRLFGSFRRKQKLSFLFFFFTFKSDKCDHSTLIKWKVLNKWHKSLVVLIKWIKWYINSETCNQYKQF